MKRSQAQVTAILLLGLIGMVGSLYAEDWPNWRGLRRDGISTEADLLQSWPEGGPPEVWTFRGLSQGYTSLAVVDGMIYTTGIRDGEGVLYALDTSGALQWDVVYAKEGGGGGYEGARTTPTVHDGTVFVVSSLGTVCAHDAKTGRQRWKVDTRAQYGAKIPKWEMAESLLVFDNTVIVTVGGKKATLVALDAKTGREQWASRSTGAASAYCSPILTEHDGKRVIVTMVESGLIGVDAADGSILFTHPHRNRHAVHPNTPILHEGMIYITSGYGMGGGMLRMVGGGVKEAWSSTDLAVHHGGVIRLDGAVIGAGDREWAALDLASGKTLWTDRLVGKGSILMAGGRIYAYSENGTVALIEANREGARIVSQFRMQEGERQHWAHPVVSGGRLYIRRGSVLKAFDIRK